MDCHSSHLHLLRQELVLEKMMQASCTCPVGFHLFVSKVDQVLLQVGCVHKQAPLIGHRNLQAVQPQVNVGIR